MHIEFEHIFGINSAADFQYSTATLRGVQPEDHDQILAQGWLAECKDNRIRWYQTRSTRVTLDSYNFKQYDPAVVQSHLFAPEEIPRRELDHIYDSYCYHKKFKKYFEVDQYPDWDQVIGYYDQEQCLCAYSKLRRYSTNSVETLMFAWDYKQPDLKLGKQTLWYELDWCQQQGYQQVYLGAAYETSSLYKTDYPGFEWWTGAQWSKDLDHYRWLLKRDSRLSKLEDLYDLEIDP